jgi:isochorismate hydrolase
MNKKRNSWPVHRRRVALLIIEHTFYFVNMDKLNSKITEAAQLVIITIRRTESVLILQRLHGAQVAALEKAVIELYE